MEQMIRVERLNGQFVMVNPDLIRMVESAPDTIIHFLDGHQLMVKTKPDEIIQRIIEFRRACTQIPPIN